MQITAEQVAKLRERTGAGMMDCKKALTENSGDFDKAIEYLRKKGIASASKKAGRTAKDGTVFSLLNRSLLRYGGGTADRLRAKNRQFLIS